VSPARRLESPGPLSIPPRPRALLVTRRAQRRRGLHGRRIAATSSAVTPGARARLRKELPGVVTGRPALRRDAVGAEFAADRWPQMPPRGRSYLGHGRGPRAAGSLTGSRRLPDLPPGARTLRVPGGIGVLRPARLPQSAPSRGPADATRRGAVGSGRPLVGWPRSPTAAGCGVTRSPALVVIRCLEDQAYASGMVLTWDLFVRRLAADRN